MGFRAERYINVPPIKNTNTAAMLRILGHWEMGVTAGASVFSAGFQQKENTVAFFDSGNRFGMRGFECGFAAMGGAYLIGSAAMAYAALFTFRKDRLDE